MLKTGTNQRAVTSNNVEIQDRKTGIPPLSRLALVALITLVSLACSFGLPQLQAEEQVKPGEVLFADDFAKPPSGWGVWAHDGALVEYHTGGLRILVKESQYDFWSVAGKDFSNVQVEVDAKKIGGPDDNDFGLICRYQDKDNFYLLVASNDGYYGIAKLKDGQYSMIGTDQLQYSQSIAAGQTVNHLRADCLDSTLRLHVNGELLMEAQDDDFSSGDVGVLAGAYDVPGVDILFDNFVVKKPLD